MNPGVTESNERLALGGERSYVEVAIPVPLRRLFTYKVPPPLRDQLEPGSRVAVSFNGRKVAGFVIHSRAEAPEGVKRVLSVAGLLEPDPIFPNELLTFLDRAAKYYMHPLGEVLRAAAPALPTGAMRRLKEDGFLKEHETLPGRAIAHKTTWFARRSALSTEGVRLGKRQRAALEVVEQARGASLETLRTLIPDPRATVRSLEQKGLVSIEEVEVRSDPFFREAVERVHPPEPTAEQAHAIETVVGALHGEPAAFLLHGVTGSGKTEVYLRVIDEAVRLGKGSLILVPEIALTPQLVARFRARFGDEIAVLHSALTDREREDAWRRLRSGDVRIGIGARSALFAPVSDLGVVIVDEEHDSSFKQEEGFRYHARDMALLRAKLGGAVCILGSATPSVETFHRAVDNKIRLLNLPERATGQKLPTVEIIDLKRHRTGPHGHPLISGPLQAALSECLTDSGQAILFLNRRGFAPSVRCEGCGQIAECPGCSVTLTEHWKRGLLRCHYCDFSRPVADGCGSCGARELTRLGLGTEKLELALGEIFPSARVARLDRDTASGVGVEEVLRQLRDGEIDILVGTQMVTKGHDVPGVTLVGVILADHSLAFPDFRASERTFQLLAQVAGRAGRADRPGRVLFQSYQPEHFAIRSATVHDYERFYHEEVATRRELGYPPFSRLVAIRVDAGSEAQARGAATTLADIAAKDDAVRDGLVSVRGPAPAPIARLRGRYRFRILLRSSDVRALRGVTAKLAARLDAGVAPARGSVDIDPVSML